MSFLFCCGSVKPYRPARLLHEDKFKAFIAWAEFPKDSSQSTGDGAEMVDLTALKPPYAIQLVRQVNYGPLESKRYFIPVEGKDNEFTEVAEDDLIQANFQKLNSYVSLLAWCVARALTSRSGTKTSSVRATTSSSRSMCIRRILLINSTGE